MKRISILGSTGSIGRSTLEVVDTFSDDLEIVGLAAGSNTELLATQIRQYRPKIVSVKTDADAGTLKDVLGRDAESVEIVPGIEGATAVATHSDADTVIAAIVGAVGIPAVHAALVHGKRVGIANKEVLVAAGSVMTSTARKHGGEILPVDSEHCAVHQSLAGGHRDEVQRILLTASGGPFLRTDIATFPKITVEEALLHPTWKMGSKITIDSATMMNKGLEVIEAHHLFEYDCEKIDIIIHPQSIVHSMVEYLDGSIIAQLSTTDMKFPIQYCIFYPERRFAPFDKLDLTRISHLEFLEVDHARFPAVDLAYEACRTGGSMPAVLNASNEIAVERFLNREIPFPGITGITRRVLDNHAASVAPIESIDDAMHWDEWARNDARSISVDELV